MKNKMKATLVKKQEGWYNLYQNDIGIGSTHTELQGYKLSLANCQAIELGYDLDEIVEQTKQTLDDSRISSYDSFKIGFQKALELMGDKKFSEEDIEKAIEFGHKTYHSWKDRNEEKFIQSLQQTEWEVEIVTEPMNLDEIREQGKGFLNSNTNKPKLDADGCLILKI